MRCPAAVPALLMLTGVTVGRLGPDLAGAPLVAAVALAWVCSLSGHVAAAPRCFVVATGFGFLAVGTLLGASPATAATETTLGRWHETQVARGLGSRTVVVEGRLVRDARADRLRGEPVPGG